MPGAASPSWSPSSASGAIALRPSWAFLAFVVAGQFAVADLIKWIVDRTRPNIDRLTGFSRSVIPVRPCHRPRRPPLPLSRCSAGIGRSSRVKAALAAVAVAVAVGIACTRVFLGVHWLTDVLAGLALGWAWFALCSIAFGGRILRFGAPVKQAQEAAKVTDAIDQPTTSPSPTGASRQ